MRASLFLGFSSPSSDVPGRAAPAPGAAGLSEYTTYGEGDSVGCAGWPPGRPDFSRGAGDQQL